MHSRLLPASVTDRTTAYSGAQPAAWPTLLVVDSDTEMTRKIVCFFEKRGFHVGAGSTLAEARDFLHRRKTWTLVIADYHLPDGNGIELCDWLDAQGCHAPVLLMSASPHCSTLCTGLDFLLKPFPIEQLEDFVRNVQRRV